MSSDFSKKIYEDAQKLFPKGEVQTLVCRGAGPGELPGAFEATVRLVHTPTGIEKTCDEFPTQIQNFIAAAIRLRIACDRRDA